MPKAKRELTRIKTNEVSLVDAAANNKEFIIVKNKKGEGMTNDDLLNPDVNTAEVTKSSKGEVVKAFEKAMESLMSISKSISDLPEGVEKLPEDITKSIQQTVGYIYDIDGKVLTKSLDGNNVNENDNSNDVADIESVVKQLEIIKNDGCEIPSDKLDILKGLMSELSGDGSQQKLEGGLKDQVNKRDPESAHKIADVDLLKAREILRDAEAEGDAEAVEKATAEVNKAEDVYKSAKKDLDEHQKAAEVEKAKADADAKAADDAKNQEVEKANQSKLILEKLDQMSKDLELQKSKNEELVNEITKMKNVSVASNANVNETATDDVNKSKSENVWGSIFR